MSEIRNLTRNGETFYPLTCTEGLVNRDGNVVGEINDIFDISEYNATGTPPVLATYSSLSLALAAVPQSKQKGGMTIRYVQTSDNKYVQWRYLLEYTNNTAGNAAFINTDNWIDENNASELNNELISHNNLYSIINGFPSYEGELTNIYSSLSLLLKVKQGDNIVIAKNSARDSYICLLKSFDIASKTLVFSESEGYTLRVTVSTTSKNITIPQDTNYILVPFNNGAEDRKPSVLTINNINVFNSISDNLKSIYDSISELASKNTVEDNLKAINQLAEFTTNGYIYASTGLVNSQGNGKVSGFIPVEQGKEYYFCATRTSTNYAAIAGYSSNSESSFVKTQMDITTIGNTNNENKTVHKVVIPLNVNYIRISYVNAYTIGCDGFWEVSEKGLFFNTVNGIAKKLIEPCKSLSEYPLYNNRIDGNNKWEVNSNNKSVVIPVTAGSKIRISSNTNSYIAFLKTYTGAVDKSYPDYSDATGYTTRITVNNTTLNFTVPDDANFMHILYSMSSDIKCPYSLVIDGIDIMQGFDGTLRALDGYRIWVGTQSEYDNISEYLSNVIYFIK